MIKIIGDYHTHTIYSHGKGTIEDNVKAAINKGLKEIVISDHGPGHMFLVLIIKN
ncbi:PHP domain-containing protein [Caloramator sp. mosi_1]|uniref:PHP domain-containing protein n=1 Tax=Caloramator sp. mosi_1 TaxID=3023090 RepID=UPI00235E5A39|nr:PHP domain-containing protein [Caloramator sp. mosi_1]WDC83585.1 PHP domain-containing protein [Caloramator sp. mosi_1]